MTDAAILLLRYQIRRELFARIIALTASLCIGFMMIGELAGKHSATHDIWYTLSLVAWWFIALQQCTAILRCSRLLRTKKAA